MKRISILTLAALITVSSIRIWGQVTSGPAPMTPPIGPVSMPTSPIQSGPGSFGGIGYSSAGPMGDRPRNLLEHALSSGVRDRLQDALDSTPN